MIQHQKHGRIVSPLENGAVLVSEGPLHMTVRAERDGRAHLDLAMMGAEHAIEVFQQMATHLQIIKQPPIRIKKPSKLPAVICKMAEAVKAIGDPSLTALAAVAGTTSDAVADFLIEKGAESVVVNNGGDIAIRHKLGDTFRIGLRTDLRDSSYSCVLQVDGGGPIGGVTTSGFGGRSLSKGIASAAVAIGENAAMADVAATVIGNATYVEDPAIELVSAEALYPDSDIAGQLIVSRIGDLSRNSIRSALHNGLKMAEDLVDRNLILGAVIALKKEIRWTKGLSFSSNRIRLLEN